MPRTTVFVSYSHKDSAWLERLQVQLKPFEREGLFHLWADTQLKPGSLWKDEITEALESARVAVLLVSGDFLASDFIVTNELPPLLRAAKENGATILPVIVSPCLYEETVLGDFTAVNSPKQALVNLKFGDSEQVFVNVARAVKESLGDERAGARPQTPGRRPTPWPGDIRRPVPEELRLWGNIDHETLRRLQPLELMKHMGLSVLQKCILDDELWVLKGTRAEHCDIEALQQLVTGGPRPRPSGGATFGLAAMATPRAVWINDEYLWELQHYYNGHALADILQEEQKPMTGAALLAVVDAIVDVLEVLHARGLVHRDINPANMLVLDGTSELRIIDWSFCCRQASTQVAVTTPGYTAPEQDAGHAVCASDWYSLGATCFALANGFTVDERGPAALDRGLQEIRLGSGEFRGWQVVEYFRGLLNRDPLARPRPWEAKRELFNIRRVSGPVHSTSLSRHARSDGPRGFVPWIARMIERVRGR